MMIVNKIKREYASNLSFMSEVNIDLARPDKENLGQKD